jgi:hypothetical protein
MQKLFLFSLLSAALLSTSLSFAAAEPAGIEIWPSGYRFPAKLLVLNGGYAPNVEFVQLPQRTDLWVRWHHSHYLTKDNTPCLQSEPLEQGPTPPVFYKKYQKEEDGTIVFIEYK